MIKRLFLLILVTAVLPSAHAALKIQAWTLDNGARVLFVESHAIPVLDLSVQFDAGARRDPEGKAGTADLTNAMLARGVQASDNEPALSEAQILDGFADTAAERGGGAGEDQAGVSLRTLSNPEQRDASIRLLARIVAQPSFPADLLERDRARQIAAIKEDDTKPESIASKAFWAALYGSHPYGWHETVESVQAITRDDLVAFHKRYYVANHAVIAMIGDVDRSEADRIAHELTRRLPQGDALPALPPVKLDAPRDERIPHPASQAHILLGMPALERGDPDYFPLIVGNYTLGGGGFVSRLMRQVREKRGLSYSVYSYFDPMAQPGPFQAGLQTKKGQADEALKVVRQTIADFLEHGPTDAELAAAKDNLIGGFPLRIDTNRKILANVAAIGFYHLPLDYLDTWTANVKKVTVEQIRAAFRHKLALDKMSTIVVGAEK